MGHRACRLYCSKHPRSLSRHSPTKAMARERHLPSQWHGGLAMDPTCSSTSRHRAPHLGTDDDWSRVQRGPQPCQSRLTIMLKGVESDPPLLQQAGVAAIHEALPREVNSIPRGPGGGPMPQPQPQALQLHLLPALCPGKLSDL